MMQTALPSGARRATPETRAERSHQASPRAREKISRAAVQKAPSHSISAEAQSLATRAGQLLRCRGRTLCKAPISIRASTPT